MSEPNTKNENENDSNQGASVSRPLDKTKGKKTIHWKKETKTTKSTNKGSKGVRRLRNTCLAFGYLILFLHAFDVARFVYLNNSHDVVEARIMVSVKLPFKMLHIGLLIVLLGGLHESKPQYARVYLVFCLIYLLIKAAIVVYTVIIEHPRGYETVYLCTIFVITILTVVSLTLYFIVVPGLTMYFLLILRNYYDQIFEEAKELPVNVMLETTRTRISSTFLNRHSIARP